MRQLKTAIAFFKHTGYKNRLEVCIFHAISKEQTLKNTLHSNNRSNITHNIVNDHQLQGGNVMLVIDLMLEAPHS